MDPDPSLGLTVLFIFVAIVLVFFNAFFVAAEFAIVKVRRTRLEELNGQGVASAKMSLILVDRLDDYLSATQLGITLVSLALGWIGEASFFNLFMILWPEGSGFSPMTIHAMATGISFFIITLLHVVLGELVPKSMAIQRAEKLTLALAWPLHCFFILAKPLIVTFTSIANVVLRLIGFGQSEEAPLSEEELKLVMKDSKEDGVISDTEAQIINRAFSFADKRVIDIMIPVEKIQYISMTRTFEENKKTILSKNHTRFPVCRTDMREVVGVVNMKDLRFLEEESNDLFIKGMRTPMYVDAGVKQDKFMKLCSEKRIHLGIVQDSYRNNIGIVTLEDVLEQLVGEIQDEHGN